MTIRIVENNLTLLVFKNAKHPKLIYDLKCVVSGGNNWFSKGYEMRIYNNINKELGYLYFRNRLFKRAELTIHFKDGEVLHKIEPTFIGSRRDFTCRFEIEKNNYFFSTHRWHHRSLFKNNEQVAKFDLEYFKHTDSEVLTITANNDENMILLVCLQLFNLIGIDEYGSMAFTRSNIGNLTGSNPPLNGKWMPKDYKLLPVGYTRKKKQGN